MSYYDRIDHEYVIPLQEDRTIRVKTFDAESPLAIGIKTAAGKMVWLPKSQVTYQVANGWITITVPAWLATKKEEEGLEFDD